VPPPPKTPLADGGAADAPAAPISPSLVEAAEAAVGAALQWSAEVSGQ
jgi:hypothetical protein